MALSVPYPYNPSKIPPIEIVEGVTADPAIKINKLAVYDFTTTPGTPGAATLQALILKANIKGVSYTFNDTPGTAYPYQNLTHLDFQMVDGEVISFELQMVSNHATWNLGTEAACIQAVTDIESSL